MGADAMNACKQTQALLFEIADGRIAAAERAEVEAHVATCPHCQQVFAAWTPALPRWRGLAPDEPSAVSMRRMENEVLRQVHAAATPRTRRIGWLALAACVGLAALGGVFALRSLAPQPFARIQTLWGRVTLSGVAMTRGAAMGPGGVLEIAAEGEASFLVGRGAEVRLLGPGRVGFDGTARSPRLRLDGGRLAVQIAPRRADESFAVVTAHGRVEVRGTRFVVGYAEPSSYVHVDEGEVAAFRAGDATPFPVKAGDTFWLGRAAEAEPEGDKGSPEPSSAPEVAPATAASHPCPATRCTEAGLRARKAMRAGTPARAVDLVEQALGQFADCSPSQRCLDELGYLRAEALRLAGRLEAAVGAFRSLNRPGATRAMSQNALYAAAQLERRLGRTADARGSLERAYAAYPDGALAEEALAALLDLLEPASAEARATAERYLARFPQGVAAGRARSILVGAPRAP
jgi:ferric-dicitrate binding protein FerR (iron transport regulator)